MYRDMVVGLCFNMAETKLLLIEKQRPDWQKGKLNGIGGHVERDELPAVAMAREFMEETGVPLEPGDWELFCSMKVEGCVVFFYRSFSLVTPEVADVTDEKLVLISLEKALPPNLIFNLHWLIPLALDSTVRNPVHVDVAMTPERGEMPVHERN